jgi:CheY-like chemotaxis protein
MSTATKTKILLADDDGDDREFFSEALASLNSNIIFEGVADGKKAIDSIVDNNAVGPSIIFLDINMPIMTGWEVLKKLKSHSEYKSIPVIVYSTSSGEKEKMIAFDLGALCFVTKPDNIKTIRAMLEIVLENIKRNDVTAKMCLEIQRMLRQGS